MEVINKTEEYDFWKFKGYQDFIDEWFLLSNPIPILTIVSVYILFVVKLGPDYMKKRPPMGLNNILLVYNFAQVLVSAFVFTVGMRLLQPVGLIHSVCELDRDTTFPVAVGIYYYFLAKLSELLDTVFFVLRKKNNQVTFLHVYHHAMMLLSSWWTLKYEPTYTTVFLGTLNCFVHIVMYTYYALSTFPKLSKYLWWKKYITSMQLIQFLCIIAQALANYYFSGCPPSQFLFNVIVFNTLLMIYLFSDFYVRSYTKTKKDKDEPKVESKDNEIQTKKDIQLCLLCSRIETDNNHEKNH